MKDEESLSKKAAVKAWVRAGIRDLYIAFVMSDRIPWNVTTFYAQALEKMCKAYIIGNRYDEYSSLCLSKATKQINKIAKDCGHNLNKMLNTLIAQKVLTKEAVFEKKYKCMGVAFYGETIIIELNEAYKSCRYPMPYNGNTSLKIPNTTSVVDLTFNSDVNKFVRNICRQIISRIKTDFGINIPEEKFNDLIADQEWSRFCNTMK